MQETQVASPRTVEDKLGMAEHASRTVVPEKQEEFDSVGIVIETTGYMVQGSNTSGN
jgi:hypothetical protein